MKLFLIFSLIKFSSAGFLFSEDPNLSQQNRTEKTESTITINFEPISDQWALQLIYNQNQIAGQPYSLMNAEQIKEAILVSPELLTSKPMPLN